MVNMCLTYKVFHLLGHKPDLAKGSEWPDIRPFYYRYFAGYEIQLYPGEYVFNF